MVFVTKICFLFSTAKSPSLEEGPVKSEVVSAPPSVWYRAERNTICMKSIQVIKFILYLELILLIGYVAYIMTFYINWNDNNEDVKNDNFPTETLEKESSSDIASVAVNDMLRTGAIDDEATSLEQAEMDSKSEQEMDSKVPTPVSSTMLIIRSSGSITSDEWRILQFFPYGLLLNDYIRKKWGTNDNLEENNLSGQISEDTIISRDGVDKNQELFEDEWHNGESTQSFPKRFGAMPEQVKDKITTVKIPMNADDPDQRTSLDSDEFLGNEPIQYMVRVIGESVDSNSKSSSEETIAPAPKDETSQSET